MESTKIFDLFCLNALSRELFYASPLIEVTGGFTAKGKRWRSQYRLPSGAGDGALLAKGASPGWPSKT